MDSQTTLSLEQIENLSVEIFRGKHNILEQWINDPKYTKNCKDILDSPNVQFFAAYFSITVLKTHVSLFFNVWDPSFRFEFSNWYLGLIFQHENLFINNKNLLAIYSEVAGFIIAEGWDFDQRFPGFIINFIRLESNENKNLMILNVLEEVSEGMRRFKVMSFNSVFVGKIIEYAIKQILNSKNKDLVASALKCILSSLNYYAIGFEKKYEDFTKLIFPLDGNIFNIILTPDFLQLLFSISLEFEASLCYELLTLIVSIDLKNISYENRRTILLFMVQNIINNANSFSEVLETGALNHFLRLVLRLKIELDKYIPPNAFNFNEFFDAVYQLSKILLSKTDSIQEYESVIGNIFLFFSTCINLTVEQIDQERLAQIYRFQIDIILQFTNNAFKFLDFDEESAVELLSLNSSDDFHPWLLTINKISQNFFPEILKILRRFLKTKNITPPKIALICNILLSIVMNFNIQQQDKNTKIYVKSISQTIVCILKNYHNFIETEYVISSFLLMLKHLDRFPFLCVPSDLSHRVYTRIKKMTHTIGSIEQMLQDLFELLWKLFINLDNPKLIYDSSKALSTLFSSKAPFHRYVISTPIVLNLVQLRVENPFPFLSKPNHMRSRIVFHSSLCTILVNRDATALRNSYLTTYDNVLSNGDEALWGFMCDFTGFFECAIKSSEYKIFFDYIFPEKLETISSMLPHLVTNQLLLISFLKLWSTLLNNETRRIEFPHHSPNGLILFHISVKMLVSLINNVKPLMAPGADITRKTICYVFRIINSLLVADYVPYNCFDYYNENGLILLLNVFKDCLGAASPSELSLYPKLEKLLLRLTLSICKKHIEVTNKQEVQLTLIIVQIISFGIRSVDSNVLDNALESFSHFMNFSQILNVHPNEIIAATFELWNLMMISPKYKVGICIRDVFAKIPDMFKIIQDKMDPFVLPDHREKFVEAFNNFFQSCARMFQDNDTTEFIPEITKFINIAVVCLRAPTKVFKM